MPDGSNLHILFGQRVRTLRERSGKTQAQLAERIGVTEQYVGMIERGRSSPSFAVIQKLCQALDVVPARLFQHPADLTQHPHPWSSRSGVPLAQPPDMGYWEKNLVTGQVFLSRTMLRMFGLLPEDTVDWNIEKFLDRVHPEDQDLVRHYEPRLLAGNGPLCFRFRFFGNATQDPCQETRTAQCWINLEADDQGNPLTACGSVYDVTESPGSPPANEQNQA